MTQITRNRRTSAAAAALLVPLAGLTLAACGGSSKGSTSKTTTSALSAQRGPFGARAASLRACLQKSGIELPKRKPGEAPGKRGGPGVYGPFGSGGGAGAPTLPKGVTRAQLQAALEKCGGGLLRGGRGIASASGRRRFAKFAACMRANGVKLPAPNTSGKGPIFNTKGIDTASATFKAAEAKCMHELRPAGAPGTGAAPGAGAPGAEGPPGAAQP